MLFDETINVFLEKVALLPSTPAGGSVAALNAASAAALAEMASRLTADKMEDGALAKELKGMAEVFHSYRVKFTDAIDEDAKVFSEVLSAYKLAADCAENRKIRDEKIQESYKKAVVVPIKLAEDIWAMMQLIKMQHHYIGDSYITDSAQAYMLAETALKSLIYHIKSNLIYIRDNEFTEKIEGVLEQFE
ncbi:cyclodeaminase/cyclohydrolase family protein [Desulfitobacterium chlororespirans]|uniref:cyclodeaminase/cyclohydrolase family protein n=1 Tax=Desulfitobacterium chlororespirans TaxID=51616 RepID=UPI0031F356DE